MSHNTTPAPENNRHHHPCPHPHCDGHLEYHHPTWTCTTCNYEHPTKH